MSDGRGTVAEVDLGAIRHNYRVACERGGGRTVIAVVKADAYGHGAVRVAGALAAEGCPRLAVATVLEAAVLREAGLGVPILVLGGVHDRAEAEAAASMHVTPVVHHRVQVELLAAASRTARRPGSLRVQVEVDTGMHRMGVAPAEAPDLLEAVAKTAGLGLEGVYTHFARADEEDLAPSLEQISEFRRVLDIARGRGIEPGLVHVANSAGILAGKNLSDALPEAAAIRPGLMLYGVRPSARPVPALRPAMTLRSRVAHVRFVKSGAPVGYGGTWRAPRDTRVATLPIGYADGIPVTAAGDRCVLLAGRRAPFAGRVSMDLVTVDAGDGPVDIGDEVVFFGEAGAERLPVEDVAAAVGTIPYEILTRVTARVPRRYRE